MATKNSGDEAAMEEARRAVSALVDEDRERKALVLAVRKTLKVCKGQHLASLVGDVYVVLSRYVGDDTGRPPRAEQGTGEGSEQVEGGQG